MHYVIFGGSVFALVRRHLLLVPEVHREAPARGLGQGPLLADLRRLQPDVLRAAPARPRRACPGGSRLPARATGWTTLNRISTIGSFLLGAVRRSRSSGTCGARCGAASRRATTRGAGRRSSGRRPRRRRRTTSTRCPDPLGPAGVGPQPSRPPGALLMAGDGVGIRTSDNPERDDAGRDDDSPGFDIEAGVFVGIGGLRRRRRRRLLVRDLRGRGRGDAGAAGAAGLRQRRLPRLAEAAGRTVRRRRRARPRRRRTRGSPAPACGRSRSASACSWWPTACSSASGCCSRRPPSSPSRSPASSSSRAFRPSVRTSALRARTAFSRSRAWPASPAPLPEPAARCGRGAGPAAGCRWRCRGPGAPCRAGRRRPPATTGSTNTAPGTWSDRVHRQVERGGDHVVAAGEEQHDVERQRATPIAVRTGRSRGRSRRWCSAWSLVKPRLEERPGVQQREGDAGQQRRPGRTGSGSRSRRRGSPSGGMSRSAPSSQPMYQSGCEAELPSAGSNGP